MKISFEGIGQVLATFAVEDTAVEGGAVTLTANGTMGLGGAGDPLCGVLLRRELDGFGTVQVEGMVCLGWSGSAPEVGYAALACDGTGGVMTAEDGAGCLVVSVDEDSRTAVVKL